MDIIQCLPFPDEICHKIVLYVFKSPHNDLKLGILKHVLGTTIYNKLVFNEKIIVKDGYVVKVNMPPLLFLLLADGCPWRYCTPEVAAKLDQSKPLRYES